MISNKEDMDIINEENNKKMTTLKTLKDIVRSKLNPFLIADFDLKAEAVKWWKKFNYGNDICCTCEEMWREFFNITEEEIKGEKEE